MKTKIFTLAIAALLFSSISYAKLFRVGYTGVALTGVDYTTAQAQNAQDDASSGDTIQIYGSGISMTINKQLVIIGFGYNFDVNTNLQAIGTDAPSEVSLTLNSGSDGTIVSGVSGSFVVYDNSGTHTAISNITFQRCKGSFSLYNHQSYGPISNIKIIGCVIDGGMSHNSIDDYPVTNLQIYNCIIGSFILYKTGTTATIVNCVSPRGSSPFSFNDASVVVKNCIAYMSNSVNNTNTVYENCFFEETQPATLPAGSNNRWNQSWATLFNRLGGTDNAPGQNGDASFDEDYYILKAGSPAINGGFNAANAVTNCGIYGGEPAYVYKLSGVPAVPAIYKLTAPGSAASTNPYNITISVRSNN